MEIKMDIRDTSKDYDDLVGFKAKENIIVNMNGLKCLQQWLMSIK